MCRLLVLSSAIIILVEQIAEGLGQVLERRGLIERDIENAWLAADAEPGPLDDLIGHSVTYRIAVGPRAGQKLFTLQTVPPRLCRDWKASRTAVSLRQSPARGTWR